MSERKKAPLHDRFNEILQHEHTLEDIEKRVEADPKHFRFYLMRANYFMRKSENSELRKCQISDLANKFYVFRFDHELQELDVMLERLKSIEPQNTEIELVIKEVTTAQTILRDLIQFRDSLSQNDFSLVMQSSPSTALEFFFRGEHINRYFMNKSSEIIMQVVLSIEKDFTKAIEMNPFEYVVETYRGSISNMDLLGAIFNTSNAISLEPIFALAYFERGSIKGRLNLYEEAISDLTISINICENLLHSPNDRTISAAYSNRGLMYVHLKMYGKAFADYQQALIINPSNKNALRNRSNLYFRIRKLELALVDLNKSLTIPPRDANSLYGRGVVLLKMCEFGLAEKDFTELIDMKEERKFDNTKYGLRAKCYLGMDLFEKAILDFTTSSRLGSLGGEIGRMEAVRRLKEKIMKM